MLVHLGEYIVRVRAKLETLGSKSRLFLEFSASARFNRLPELEPATGCRPRVGAVRSHSSPQEHEPIAEDQDADTDADATGGEGCRAFVV